MNIQIDKYAPYQIKKSTRVPRDTLKKSSCKAEILTSIEGDMRSKVSKIKQPVITEFFGDVASQKNIIPKAFTFKCSAKKKPSKSKPMPKLPPHNNHMKTNYTIRAIKPQSLSPNQQPALGPAQLLQPPDPPPDDPTVDC